jgi:hypothetical protein
MGRKSFKAGSWHHTKTNARNVQRNNRGSYWNNKYWKNLRKKEKNQNKRHKAAVKNILENALILLVIFSLIAVMCYFSM